MFTIQNARLILPDRVIENGTLLYDRTIRYAGPFIEPSQDTEVFDARGLYVGPGFFDIHCHGGGPNSFGDYPEKAAAWHLSHGTTSVLATLSYGDEPENRLIRAGRICDAMRDTPSIAGIHLEGPFKNPKFGFPGKYQTPATVEYAKRLFDACRGQAKLMMAAPDVENLEPILALARAYGIPLACGHGSATRETYAMMKRYGLINATHHYCASGDYTERMGVRKVAMDELVDLDDSVYAEIIPDHLGAHVAPERIRLCIRCKGLSRIHVITDSVPFTEDDASDTRTEQPPRKPHSSDDCDIHWVDGKLDGSELTMDKACYNMKRHSGLPTEDVWRMASINPARMLGMSHIGRLEPGCDADILIADEDFNLHMVISKGRRVL
ncbi:MAG: amidohydrolase family protein [Eubacteriales bacterium]|jgi:N-acetylglucosamine-6-phosphate deacetylase